MLKSTSKNLIQNFMMSLLTKHQKNLHLHVENTTYWNYQWKFLQIKTKIQHQHIHKHESQRRNLLTFK